MSHTTHIRATKHDDTSGQLLPALLSRKGLTSCASRSVSQSGPNVEDANETTCGPDPAAIRCCPSCHPPTLPCCSCRCCWCCCLCSPADDLFAGGVWPKSPCCCCCKVLFCGPREPGSTRLLMSARLSNGYATVCVLARGTTLTDGLLNNEPRGSLSVAKSSKRRLSLLLCWLAARQHSQLGCSSRDRRCHAGCAAVCAAACDAGCGCGVLAGC